MLEMLSRKITCILLACTGMFGIAKAVLTVTITSFEPKSSPVFTGDVIKLTCESSDSGGSPSDITITWHQADISSRALQNSSTTTITSRIKDNKLIGSLTTSVGTIEKSFLHVFCKARSRGSTKNVNHLFTYEKEPPRLRVELPEIQAVDEGTRRHILVCQVSSNVDINLVTVKWIFANKTLKEKTVNLKKNETVNDIILLQCLTEKDLGDYTCTANGTKYWMIYESATTTLTGNFTAIPGNSGAKITSSFVKLLCLLLIMRMIF